MKSRQKKKTQARIGNVSLFSTCPMGIAVGFYIPIYAQGGKLMGPPSWFHLLTKFPGVCKLMC